MPRSKVLIIADNVESANVWEDALRRRCIESIHLGYGVQTLNIFLPEPNSFALSLVDSQTGGDTALAICASVRAMSDKPILLLTPENDERYQLKAYDAGVDEYLVTPANVLLVTAKIKVWLQRVAAAEHLSEELSESGFRLNPKTHQVFTPDGKAVKLSAHELRLLRLLLANPGRVLPTDFLISRVWSHDARGDKKLLINLVYRLREKIDVAQMPTGHDTLPKCWYARQTAQANVSIETKPRHLMLDQTAINCSATTGQRQPPVVPQVRLVFRLAALSAT